MPSRQSIVPPMTSSGIPDANSTEASWSVRYGLNARASSSTNTPKSALSSAVGGGTDRPPQRLADAQPILVEIVGKCPEVARAPAYQPSEDDAAANVLQAQAPLIDRSEVFPNLRRKHSLGNLVGEECPEDLVGPGDLVFALRR